MEEAEDMEESVEETPNSLRTSADWRGLSDKAPIEPLLSPTSAAGLTLNSKAEMICENGTACRPAGRVTDAHSGVDL